MVDYLTSNFCMGWVGEWDQTLSDSSCQWHLYMLTSDLIPQKVLNCHETVICVHYVNTSVLLEVSELSILLIIILYYSGPSEGNYSYLIKIICNNIWYLYNCAFSIVPFTANSCGLLNNSQFVVSKNIHSPLPQKVYWFAPPTHPSRNFNSAPCFLSPFATPSP